MKNHILLQICAYSFLRQINKRLCLIPNKPVLFSVNAFAPTKSPHRHYIIFYIKNQGGGKIGSFLVWWRCRICSKQSLRNSEVYELTRRRSVSPGTGVHVAKQRHDEIVQNPRIDDIKKQVEQEVQLVSRLVEMRGLPYSDCYRRSIACSRRGSHGDAVLRFFKIAINPRFGIKKEQPSLFLFLVEMRGFEPRFVLLHPTPSTCLFGD